MGNDKNYYIDKEELYNTVKKYKETGCKISYERIGKYILDISTAIASDYKYNRYPFLEEMIGDAIVDCIKGIDKIDLDNKSKNIYSYFTVTVWRAFWRRIANEKTNLYVKFKYQLDNQHMDNLTPSDREIVVGNVGDFHKMIEFVNEYEHNKNKKKK